MLRWVALFLNPGRLKGKEDGWVSPIRQGCLHEAREGTLPILLHSENVWNLTEVWSRLAGGRPSFGMQLRRCLDPAPPFQLFLLHPGSELAAVSFSNRNFILRLTAIDALSANECTVSIGAKLSVLYG